MKFDDENKLWAEVKRMHEDGNITECMYVLVTGANSGVGFAICCRLIEEFLSTRSTTESLHLIFTSRDSTKSAATAARLHQHLNKFPPKSHHRIALHPENLDLTSLSSVKALAQRLLTSNDVPKLDSIILNAGTGGFTGINWPNAIWSVMTSPVQALTYPTFKIGAVGSTTPSQQFYTGNDHKTVDPIPNDPQAAPHPPLGEVFCANVFGHYLLTHFLTPLLVRASPKHGRIIWISSLEALAHDFSPADLQGLSSPHAYESSKRLTDVLALTSSLPYTQPFVSRFTSPPISKHDTSPSPSTSSNPPKIYLAHPGVCATAIIPLPLILSYCMILSFYIGRWLGSPWHTITAYIGACAPVWLALALQDELDAMEGNDDDGNGRQRKIKWGSSTDWAGRERVRRTEVQGLITSSSSADGHGSGSSSNEKNAVMSQEFEELGRTCWMRMEALREEWEERLGF